MAEKSHFAEAAAASLAVSAEISGRTAVKAATEKSLDLLPRQRKGLFFLSWQGFRWV
jgi:hypothetical protein